MIMSAFLVAIGGKADMGCCSAYVRFSNRPVWVKRFQAIHQYSVDVAHGLALLFGIGTKALPLWGSRMGWNNLLVGLARDRGQIQADIRSHLIHRPARDIIPPLGGARVFSCQVRSFAVLMPLRPLGSSGTQCHQPRCDA